MTNFIYTIEYITIREIFIVSLFYLKPIIFYLRFTPLRYQNSHTFVKIILYDKVQIKNSMTKDMS